MKPASELLDLSIVSPVYQAEACLGAFHQRLTAALADRVADYEVILVEDGSSDGSWTVIETLSAADPRVRGLRLSRNFGQHLAIAAGLGEARGRRVVVMDCDLQDRPEDLQLLLAAADEGHELVLTRRRGRTDGPFKRLTSYLFFFLMNRLSAGFHQPGVGAFSLLSARVVREYLRATDRYSLYLSTLGWLGFRPVVVEVEHGPRHSGRSSYSLPRLISHALAGLTMQTTRLLHLSTIAGIFASLVAVLMAIYYVYRRLFHSIGVEGWASLMVVVLLVGGAVLLSLGVLGLYLRIVFEHSRARPLFVVGERTEPRP